MLDNNPNVELDMKLLNKFGQNELGKKWNKLSDEKKQNFISRYFSECDIQETLEETGMIVKEPKFCGILTETSPTNYNWISYIFYNEIEYINPPISDEGKLEWIEYDKIKKIPTPLTDHHIYQFILQKKKFIINAEYDEELNLLEMFEEISNSKIK